MTAAAAKSRPRVPKWAQSAEEIRERWVIAMGEYRTLSTAGARAIFGCFDLSERLCRLFMVACCRHPLLVAATSDQRARDAVTVAELHADGLCGDGVRKAAWSAAGDTPYCPAHGAAMSACSNDAHGIGTGVCAEMVIQALYPPKGAPITTAADVIDFQARLLVAVVGPGWRFSPAWRTDTAVALARVMYEARSFDAMPILADALADAGAPDGPMLEQGRDPEAVWCRGCRIVDELLGKRS